ncbi:MAG: DUF3631 domain-containing protein [Solirubrobacterales bacterium]|nr:DUF3631 domain-containing protein [Solirubrobacterales bacterium]
MAESERGKDAPPSATVGHATELDLLPQHRKLIEASAISAEVALARGYRSVTDKRELDGLFGPVQQRVPGLLAPLYDVYGERRAYQLRPDDPRVKEGRTIKYETPRGLRMMLDCPPSTLEHVREPKVQLWITEGVRKADSLASFRIRALGLLGIDCWRGTNDRGGKTILEDWHGVALNGRTIVICFDSDAFQKPQIHRGTERLGRWLESRGAKLAFVYLPHRADGSKQGVDDFLAEHSRDELLARIETTWHPLPHSTVHRNRSAFDATTPLRPTGELLADVCGVLQRFMVLPSEHAAVAIALWVAHTWAFEAAYCTPYLGIRSAAKRSAKTRLEELLELVVRRPWRVAAASEAAMFRKIASDCPSLLLDVGDAIFGSKTEATEPLRALLNAGNRPGAAVARVVGEGANLVPVDFSVYCPKVLAGIITTRWPDTILDRSIIVTLQRKRPDEHVERLRHRKLAAETEALRAKLARWAHEHAEALAEAEPQLPAQLNDRAAEAWEPLLAIADLAGSEWGVRARRAAVKLADVGAESDAHGVLALAALRDVFGDQEALHTDPILKALNDDDQLPFGDYRKGAGLNSRGLAKLLEPYAIRPQRPYVEGVQARGYKREQFTDAWARYCPQKDDSETETPPGDGSDPSSRLKASSDGGFRHFSDPSHQSGQDGSKTAENPDEHWEQDGKADTTRHKGGATKKTDVSEAPPSDGQMTIEDCIEVAEKGLDGWHGRAVSELSDEELLAIFPGSTLGLESDVAECGCTRRTREWRLRGEGVDVTFTHVSNASYREAVNEGRDVLDKGKRSGWVWETTPLGRGQLWQCALCHPPVAELDVEWRDAPETEGGA